MIKLIEFVDYIRKQKCIICFNSNPDPDHLNQIGMGRNRNKNLIEHLSCIPLCRSHHIERHSMGNLKFERKHNINLWKENHEYLMQFIKKSL